MDAITVKVNLLDEIKVNAEGLDEIVIYVNNYSPEISNLTTSLESHLNEKVNPHAADAVQEFADAQITNLKSVTDGGEIPDTDYNAFKAFFVGLVDKSVKSFIRGLVSWVNSLATRVGLLEDRYILKYVVPVDSISVDLTQDRYGNPFNFVEGDNIEVTVNVGAFVGGTNRIFLRINGVSANVYIQTNAIINVIMGAGSLYYGHFTNFHFKVNGGEVIGYSNATAKTAEDGSTNLSQFYPFSSRGLNLTSISSLNFSLGSSLYPIPAGTVFLVKKM